MTAELEQIFKQFDELARITPKDSSNIVFIGEANGYFTGNVKHLFLHVVRNHPEINATFLTTHKHISRMLREAKLPVVVFPEDNSVSILAKAHTIVVDTFNFKQSSFAPLTNYARIIQLWHGVGFKKIGLVEEQSIVTKQYNDMNLGRLYSGYDTVVSTSPFYSEEVFRKSFNAKHFVDFGYPRNDALFRLPTKDSMLNCDTDAFRLVGSLKKTHKTVLYAPTFRDNVGSPFSGGLDFQKLQEFLEEKKLQLFIKTHTQSGISLTSTTPNITIYRNECDVYPFMRMIDVMMTDYSSIYMDYLLLDRPVVFYCPDYVEYITQNREFQFPYEDMTPGAKCMNQEELHAALELAAYGDDGYEEQRLALKDKAFLHHDGDSAKRIVEYIRG
ncbi:MAG: CDP-glycerol glycerophosphotransferase family protein [Pseudodesulfovibrio sp.]